MPLKLAWEIKFHNVLTGSNLKLYLIQLCFYSWGSWEEIQLRKLKEITCIITGHIILKTRLEAKFCGSQLSALSTLCTLTKTKQNDEFVAKLSISKSENLRWKEQCLPSCSQTGGFLWGKCRSHFFFSVYWLPRGLLPYWIKDSESGEQGNLLRWHGHTWLLGSGWHPLLILRRAVSSCACVLSWDPMNCISPGFSVSGIFEARILEWVAISYYRGSSLPRDQTQVSCVSCIWQADSLPLSHLGSPFDSKESSCNVGYLGSIPGLGRSPGGGHGNPLQYSCLENAHGQRSLVGYGSWGRIELDPTEWLRTTHRVSLSFHCTPALTISILSLT